MSSLIRISISVLVILLIWAAITGLMVLITKGLRKLFKKDIVLTTVNMVIGIIVVGIAVNAVNKSAPGNNKSVATTGAAAVATTEGTTNKTEKEYIGNSNSGKFHRPTCEYLPEEQNQVIYKTREDAISAGMVPCKVCDP
ncbi:MAG: Ada metal-binding domain-containing protein [Candidatus Ornithomonoglobus sp.]